MYICTLVDGENITLYWSPTSCFTLSVNKAPFRLCASSSSFPLTFKRSLSQSIHSPYLRDQSKSCPANFSEIGISTKSKFLPQQLHQIGSAPISPSIFNFVACPISQQQFNNNTLSIAMNLTIYLRTTIEKVPFNEESHHGRSLGALKQPFRPISSRI